MPTIDRATLEAVRSTKKELHAKEAQRRATARIGTRKRASIKVVGAKAEAARSIVAARQTSAQQIMQDREALRADHVESGQRQAANIRYGQARGAVVGGAVSTITPPSSNTNLFMVVIFTIVGLAVFYNVVTNADKFSGFLGGAGDFLQKLSSTDSLFQVTKT